MEVTRKNLDNSQVELTITIPVEEIKPYLEIAANKISKETKIDGFRPGKVPYEVLKEKVGEEAILQEAAQEIVNKTYQTAIFQEKITNPIAQPEIKVDEIKPGQPLVYRAIVSILPKLELADLKTVKVVKKKVEVKDEQIEKTISEIRKMRSSEKLVKREAKNGDKVEVDFEVTMDGVVIEGGKAQKQPIILGEGNFIPGFEENVVGMKDGEEKKFKLTFPKDYFQKSLAGREHEFKVKLISVYEVIMPEIDDEFVKTLGDFKTAEEFKKQIKENIAKEAEEKEKQRFQAAILGAIIDKSDFQPLPPVLIESEQERMIQEMKQDMESKKLKFVDYLIHIKKTEQELKDGFKDQAIKRVKSALITREVAIKNKIEVKPEELEAEIKKTLAFYESNPEMGKQFKSPGYKDYLERILINQRVLKHLEDNVTIEEEK